MKLELEYLEKLEQYMDSGDLQFDFEHSPEAKKHAILEFLDKFMDVAEKADEIATKIIYKDSFLGQLSGVATPGDDDEDAELKDEEE
jgi:hypothetical protein